MHKHSLFCRAAALVLTLALTAALALPGFAAAYAMPIQTAYDAEAVYLFDASTGEALVEQNPDQVRPIASLTKMMTALLVLESGADLNESIPIPDSLTPEFQAIRANRGHTIGLQAGESVRRLDMLYAMLVPSANDAASVLASDAAGGDLAAFAARMNARASQLGCTNTHFTCPHGLYDHNNYSTARDMAKIALACHANGTYMQVANTVSYTLPATNLHPAAVTVAGLAHGAAALAPQQGLGRRSACGVEVIGRHAAGRKARAQPLFAHQQEAVGHPAAVQHHADALFQLRIALDPVDHHRLFFLFHCSRRIHARTLRAACGPKNAAKPTMQSR